MTGFNPKNTELVQKVSTSPLATPSIMGFTAKRRDVQRITRVRSHPRLDYWAVQPSPPDTRKTFLLKGLTHRYDKQAFQGFDTQVRQTGLARICLTCSQNQPPKGLYKMSAKFDRLKTKLKIYGEMVFGRFYLLVRIPNFLGFCFRYRKNLPSQRI